MPAKREAVYGAVYRLQADGRLAVVRAEAVVPAAEWESALAKPTQDKGAIPMRRVETIAGAGIADSVTGVMSIAMADWERGERPEWSSVMPFYGQHPVTR
ncbi:MAG: tRNA (adenosine(37)-N6)-threonylcarbamoyltransferase complex dimerization subunit type 1 TsaB, partial [Cyanobacteria bacterium P01_D01_bin.36]